MDAGWHDAETMAHLEGEVERLLAALKEARLQIEYLDAKFQPTGTSANVLARIEAVLTADEQNAPDKPEVVWGPEAASIRTRNLKRD